MQTDGSDQGGNAGGQLHHEGLHGEDDAFVTAVILQFAVVNCVGQEYCGQYRQHTEGGEDEEGRNEEYEQRLGAGTHQNQQHSVSTDGHGKAQEEHLGSGQEPAQYREEDHHGDDLHSAAEGVKQRVAVFPCRTCKIIFEEIDQQIGCDVQGAVDQDDGDDHGHGLIVLDQRRKHLLDGRGFHIDGGLLLDGQAGKCDEYDEEYRNDDGKQAESCMLIPMSQNHDALHGDDGDESRAHAGTGTSQCGQVLTLFATVREGRDHGPEGNVHHGVGDTPYDVGDGGIGHQTASVHCRWCGIHQIQYHSVGNGSDHQPGTELTEAGAGLGDDDSHDGVIESVEHTGGHQDHSHGDGSDPQDVLVIIEDIVCGQHVHHILSHGAEAVGEFFF